MTDVVALEKVFLATFQPGTTKQAEEQLRLLCHTPGFSVSLSQLLGKSGMDVQVQKAVAVYLKNHLLGYWVDRGTEHFSIPADEKAAIRDNIVDIICGANTQIQVILAVAFGRILNHDYPERMPNVVAQIGQRMQSQDMNVVVGSLFCFLEISKRYEYKTANEREHFDSLIPDAFAFLLQIGNHVVAMDTLEKALILKLVLKIFYNAIHYTLPTQIQDQAMLTPWMTLIGQVVSTDVPEMEDPITGKNPAWLAKKWACSIILELFTRYGLPATARDEHKAFAEMFVKSYATPATEMALTLLINSKRENKYLSSRVQQVCINIVTAGTSHGTTWKVVKPHLETIVSDVIFPVLCHNDKDEELWQDDPQEYTREKFDVMADFVSPAVAAQNLLTEIATRRKNTLMPCLQFCNSILVEYQNALSQASQQAQSEALVEAMMQQGRRKDGALCMIGTLARLINKKKELKGTLETMLMTHVIPEFSSSFGFMRARACWVMQYFHGVALRNEAVVIECMDSIIRCLHDPDLPVRVMAGVGLKVMVEHPAAKERIRPHLGQVLNELIKLTNEAENDDVVTVMEDLVAVYGTDLGDVSITLSAQLAQTFINMVKSSSEDNDEDVYKAMTALGTLRAMMTIVAIYQEAPEMLVHIEKNILPCIYLVLNDGHVDYLEDVLEMLTSCLFHRQEISSDVWALFPALYEIFTTDAFDYFNEMMPVIDQCLSNGSATFFDNADYLSAVYNMCTAVMANEDAGEEMHMRAAMLCGSVFTNLRGDKFPSDSGLQLPEEAHKQFLLLLLKRLNQPMETMQLKVSLLMALAEGIFSNAAVSLAVFEGIQPSQTDYVFSMLCSHLEKFTRVHDLQLLIGLFCELLCLSEEALPMVLRQKYGPVTMMQIVATCFQKIPEAEKRREKYEELYHGEVESEDEEEFNEADAAAIEAQIGDEVDDDDDFEDEEGDAYLRRLEKMAQYRGEDGEDGLDDDLFDEDDLCADNIIDNMDPYVLLSDTIHGKRPFKGGNPTQPGIGSPAQVGYRTPEGFRALLEGVPQEVQQVLMGVCQTAVERQTGAAQTA
ncbi:hypothetical protein SARC_08026 [Sphaeroforma arctica JP610]|uniref:Importin N-terminal domain-containing protein n=1 Tax=Sphaeroforma arctica JP610 TaxID=667725 RepID=A0A0L0FUJ2_9EUKA|nr:hypothetical protein SARC_08026 [Sphaeroforma arctica JP610]KNC79578.1 hypothetical protein SARC_08026 [Sphaeroforma arctica JP610]|eukprot:XP_014153480.1 hypothetical protein SARC_08026 [Sphaeroforma arctica JP610]